MFRRQCVSVNTADAPRTAKPPQPNRRNGLRTRLSLTVQQALSVSCRKSYVPFVKGVISGVLCAAMTKLGAPCRTPRTFHGSRRYCLNHTDDPVLAARVQAARVLGGKTRCRREGAPGRGGCQRGRKRGVLPRRQGSRLASTICDTTWGCGTPVCSRFPPCGRRNA